MSRAAIVLALLSSFSMAEALKSNRAEAKDNSRLNQGTTRDAHQESASSVSVEEPYMSSVTELLKRINARRPSYFLVPAQHKDQLVPDMKGTPNMNILLQTKSRLEDVQTESDAEAVWNDLSDATKFLTKLTTQFFLSANAGAFLYSDTDPEHVKERMKSLGMTDAVFNLADDDMDGYISPEEVGGLMNVVTQVSNATYDFNSKSLVSLDEQAFDKQTMYYCWSTGADEDQRYFGHDISNHDWKLFSCSEALDKYGSKAGACSFLAERMVNYETNGLLKIFTHPPNAQRSFNRILTGMEDVGSTHDEAQAKKFWDQHVRTLWPLLQNMEKQFDFEEEEMVEIFMESSTKNAKGELGLSLEGVLEDNGMSEEMFKDADDGDGVLTIDELFGYLDGAWGVIEAAARTPVHIVTKQYADDNAGRVHTFLDANFQVLAPHFARIG